MRRSREPSRPPSVRTTLVPARERSLLTAAASSSGTSLDALATGTTGAGHWRWIYAMAVWPMPSPQRQILSRKGQAGGARSTLRRKMSRPRIPRAISLSSTASNAAPDSTWDGPTATPRASTGAMTGTIAPLPARNLSGETGCPESSWATLSRRTADPYPRPRVNRSRSTTRTSMYSPARYGKGFSAASGAGRQPGREAGACDAPAHRGRPAVQRGLRSASALTPVAATPGSWAASVCRAARQSDPTGSPTWRRRTEDRYRQGRVRLLPAGRPTVCADRSDEFVRDGDDGRRTDQDRRREQEYASTADRAVAVQGRQTNPGTAAPINRRRARPRVIC